nr:hypothetical protein [Rhodoferax sp.]
MQKLIQRYEVATGVEAHAQLFTQPEVVSQAPAAFDAMSNTQAYAVIDLDSPAMSIPVGFGAAGMQLLGNYFQESRLLNAAHRFQQATDFHAARPAGF